ncbi:MAG: DegV family protein [Lachnospiraceae bacterium]|nr:DegV family protein [Lachnospiraceae bacterium]
MDFKIVIDSGGEIPEDLRGTEQFVSVPLTLEVGSEQIIDDGHISQRELVAKIAACPTSPKTACPSPEAFYKEFSANQAEHIYAVTLSAELSGSYQSAVIGMNMLLEEHPDTKIHVFNSRSASVGETLVLLKIKELEESGCSFEEVIERTEQYISVKQTYFVLDNLETLRKNGRLSGVKALAATMLKIKPICIGNENGQIEQLDQARGMNKAIVKMVDHAAERAGDASGRILGISYVNCRDRAVMVRDAMLSRVDAKESVVLQTGGLSTIYANDGGVIVVI